MGISCRQGLTPSLNSLFQTKSPSEVVMSVRVLMIAGRGGDAEEEKEGGGGGGECAVANDCRVC